MGHEQEQQARAVCFRAEALADYEEILTHYPRKRAALMPVLWLAQREFGWLSKPVQAYVAGLLDLPIAWVEGAVSFYTMYATRPRGKHHIQICTNISCRLRGADEVFSAVRRRLGIKPGETRGDGKFSLERVECLGSCATAPVMQLNDRYIEGLSVEEALAVLDRLEQGEQL